MYPRGPMGHRPRRTCRARRTKSIIDVGGWLCSIRDPPLKQWPDRSRHPVHQGRSARIPWANISVIIPPRFSDRRRHDARAGMNDDRPGAK